MYPMTRASNPLRHHILCPGTSPRETRYHAPDGGWTLDRTEAGRMAGRWMDVGEAARELDISTDAVRKRISRGSLESRRENGSVLVWLDDGGTEAGHEAQVDSEVLVESLRDQVGYLRSQLDIRTEELREHRRIIAALTQRIPEIEAPTEPTGPAESPSEPAQEPAENGVRVGYPPPRTDDPHSSEKPWWRRVFGG